MFATRIAAVLRAAGLNVVEVDGWQTRGYRGGSTPNGQLDEVAGGLVHHTGTPATAAGNYPTLRIVRDGRSDVPGPLAQLGLGRDGTWYVVSAGRANHSGEVANQKYHNRRALGIEAEHPGGSAPWPVEQYRSYVIGCAALAKEYGIVWRGHKEEAVPKGRKVDPNFDMDCFRVDVEAAKSGIVPAAPTAPSGSAPAPARSWLQRGDVSVEVGEYQVRLRSLGYYTGKVDNSFGPLMLAAVRAFQFDYRLDVDGFLGPKTKAAVVAAAAGQPVPTKNPFGDPLLAVDGSEGPKTVKGEQLDLRRKGLYGGQIDGSRGPLTVKADQKYLASLGLYKGQIDGSFGLQSTRAEQTRLASLGLYTGRIDGSRGPLTIKARQLALNAGKY